MTTAALGFALVAGAVAAFNPCGFALLPAYLGMLVSDADADADADAGRAAAIGRAARFAAGMTVGFVGVFGLAAAVLVPLAVAFERYLPVVTIVVGVVLVGLGVLLLTGRGLGLRGLRGLGGVGTAPTATSWWSQAGYGVSFALASLSCTIGPFLAVTAGALSAGGPLRLVSVFVAYALGMGTVVLVLALAVVTARTSLVGSMRRAGAVINRVSGALLVIAGAYVAWYGWYEIRVLSGSAGSDPVIEVAVSTQEAVVRSVRELGAAGLLTVVAVLVVLGLGVLLYRRARAHRRESPTA